MVLDIASRAADRGVALSARRQGRRGGTLRTSTDLCFPGQPDPPPEVGGRKDQRLDLVYLAGTARALQPPPGDHIKRMIRGGRKARLFCIVIFLDSV